eukprot:scaffold270705_cov14-Tisochrysis_lutea.AAC.1
MRLEPEEQCKSDKFKIWARFSPSFEACCMPCVHDFGTQMTERDSHKVCAIGSYDPEAPKPSHSAHPAVALIMRLWWLN